MFSLRFVLSQVFHFLMLMMGANAVVGFVMHSAEITNPVDVGKNECKSIGRCFTLV